MQTTSDRREILKRKHLILKKQLGALQEALYRLTETPIESMYYHEMRLAVIRAFELVFYALSAYMAEKVGMEYEFEQPDRAASVICEAAFKKNLISNDEYIACQELIALFGMVGQVFEGDVADELCQDIEELFPTMCSIAHYSPEDLPL